MQRELNRLLFLNAAARLIFAASKYDHVTPLLCDLHWLRVPEHIDFKIAVLVYRCLHGLAPVHLSTELQSVEDMPSIEAAITVMVFEHFSHPDVAAVYCRRPSFFSHCGTSLERLWTLSRRLLCQLSSDCSSLNSSHGAFLMHDTAPAAHDYLNCLSDFRRDIVMWSCSYLAYAT